MTRKCDAATTGWMARWKPLLCLILCSTLVAACASKEKREEDAMAKLSARMSDPSITAVPITPTEPPRVARIPQDPIPVYKPAKIRQVTLDAYVNERGEAFPPTTKYVVEDPGGWNMEALRSPQVAYVPPSSSLEIPVAPGMQYTTMNQTVGSQAPPKDANGARFLYNLKDVKITGFTEMSQEGRARSAASPSEATIFDEKLGWVLVPKSVLSASTGTRDKTPPKVAARPPEVQLTKGDGVKEAPKPSDFDLINSAPPPPPRGQKADSLGEDSDTIKLPEMD